MASIKKFFEKKKADIKFKKAGTGHTLTEDCARVVQPQTQPSVRHQPTPSANMAGAAALSRFEGQTAKSNAKPTSSNATWKQSGGATAIDAQQMKRDMMGGSSQPPPPVKRSVSQESSNLAVSSLMFTCPICPFTADKPEIYEHFHECLKKDLQAEPLMITVTMIHSLNTDREKVDNCTAILSKYLQNIVDNVGVEKYCKIRRGNKVFQEKVAPLKGSHEFLTLGCGYQIQTMSFEVNGESSEQEFYVLPAELATNTEQLTAAKDMLQEAEPLLVTLDRNLKVYMPCTSANKMEVPASFYTLTSTELKKEAEFRKSEIEKMEELRTKAMRERAKRVYHYLVLRVRFPDRVLLQGTFSVKETLQDVKIFVLENLHQDWLPFTLIDSIGQQFPAETTRLSQLKLAPASLLNFSIDASVLEDVKAASPDQRVQYLKDEVLALMANLQ